MSLKSVSQNDHSSPLPKRIIFCFNGKIRHCMISFKFSFLFRFSCHIFFFPTSDVCFFSFLVVKNEKTQPWAPAGLPAAPHPSYASSNPPRGSGEAAVAVRLSWCSRPERGEPGWIASLAQQEQVHFAIFPYKAALLTLPHQPPCTQSRASRVPASCLRHLEGFGLARLEPAATPQPDHCISQLLSHGLGTGVCPVLLACALCPGSATPLWTNPHGVPLHIKTNLSLVQSVWGVRSV